MGNVFENLYWTTANEVLKTEKPPKRPTCSSHGCDKLCQNMICGNENIETEWVRWRHTCSHCHKAGMGLHPYAEGVRPFAKGYCENWNGSVTGRACLHFEKKGDCIVPIGTDAFPRLEIDHKDENYYNNDHDNLQELCNVCHCDKTTIFKGHQHISKKQRPVETLF